MITRNALDNIKAKYKEKPDENLFQVGKNIVQIQITRVNTCWMKINTKKIKIENESDIKTAIRNNLKK